jgi:hypothetical protein
MSSALSKYRILQLAHLNLFHKSCVSAAAAALLFCFLFWGRTIILRMCPGVVELLVSAGGQSLHQICIDNKSSGT